VDRMACVDLPAFPLQLLLRRKPEWRRQPVAVVESDTPQARILWVNERARASRVLPGMRYAASLSLDGDLRAAEVSDNEIRQAVTALGRILRNFTPHVEPASEDPGSFWLDATGLERLYPSHADWAGRIRSRLEGSGFEAAVTVGFGRFGTYALARSRPGVTVLRCSEEERIAARRVPLDRLRLAPSVREVLEKLGVRTVGGFLDLPVEGVGRRFDGEALRLHRLASGELRLPLQPERPLPPAQRRAYLDHPATDVQRLMSLIEQLLAPLLETLGKRGQVLSRIHVGFRFERLGDHIETISPAAPTSSAPQLLELVRLRLEALRKLPDGVNEVVLVADATAATEDQQAMFAERPKRDVPSANRALARLRAELGDEAVTRPRLREGHLPEAGFEWERTDRISIPRPRELDSSRLVRRIYTRPVPLPSRARHEPDGWMLRGLQQGPVTRVDGPYIVSGGWWHRTVHREYHFAETQKGELLWVYYDRPRRRWYLQGRVE